MVMSQKMRTSFQNFNDYIPSLTSFGGEKTARILSLAEKRLNKFLNFGFAPLEAGWNLSLS